MTATYSDRDPRGWCGDPARGAAMGRPAVDGPAAYDGRLILRRVRLDSGGYDSLGTYWGHGGRLYWYSAPDGSFEGTLRASNRDAAKAEVRRDYPRARFYR